MTLALPLLLGFFAAIIGVFPPGLINMTAAKISIQEDKNRALLFVLGALIVVVFQTFLALIFATYINTHKEILLEIREVGFVVFTVLTLYFIWTAKKNIKKQKEIKLKSKKSRFFLGILISILNIFPIPYYSVIAITFASFKYFVFNKISIYYFIIGTVTGSFLIFYTYIAFFKKIESKATFLIKNMNYIMAVVTGTIAIITLFNILQYYF